jgi:hypothetical protein
MTNHHWIFHLMWTLSLFIYQKHQKFFFVFNNATFALLFAGVFVSGTWKKNFIQENCNESNGIFRPKFYSCNLQSAINVWSYSPIMDLRCRKRVGESFLLSAIFKIDFSTVNFFCVNILLSRNIFFTFSVRINGYQ